MQVVRDRNWKTSHSDWTVGRLDIISKSCFIPPQTAEVPDGLAAFRLSTSGGKYGNGETICESHVVYALPRDSKEKVYPSVVAHVKLLRGKTVWIVFNVWINGKPPSTNYIGKATVDAAYNGESSVTLHYEPEQLVVQQTSIPVPVPVLVPVGVPVQDAESKINKRAREDADREYAVVTKAVEKATKRLRTKTAQALQDLERKEGELKANDAARVKDLEMAEACKARVLASEKQLNALKAQMQTISKDKEAAEAELATLETRLNTQATNRERGQADLRDLHDAYKCAELADKRFCEYVQVAKRAVCVVKGD